MNAWMEKLVACCVALWASPANRPSGSQLSCVCTQTIVIKYIYNGNWRNAKRKKQQLKTEKKTIYKHKVETYV